MPLPYGRVLYICGNVSLRKWCAHVTGQSHAVAHKGGDRKVAIMNCYPWDGPETLRRAGWAVRLHELYVAVCTRDSMRYLAACLA